MGGKERARRAREQEALKKKKELEREAAKRNRWWHRWDKTTGLQTGTTNRGGRQVSGRGPSVDYLTSGRRMNGLSAEVRSQMERFGIK